MSRPRPLALAGLLALVVIVLGGLPLLKGAFYVGKHEGDTMHLAELVLRMANGQWPHLDFMTPIGVLAIAPIAIFVREGFGLGHAIFYAQILVALTLFLPVMRVALSRLTGPWPYLYGAFVMLLCLALVHGEAESSVSISMHYNRWAWAVSYIVLPLAILAPLGTPRPWLDGLIVGVGMGLLVLTKVTYFAAFAPAVTVALLARRERTMLLAALIGGLGVAALTTAIAGPDFWAAYLKDLMTVAGGDARSAPGESFVDVIVAPLYMGGSLAIIAAVIFLRQAGRQVEGLALLVLMPGCFYVAYQNFGNDPQWLYLVAMLSFLLRPDYGHRNGMGWDLREALTVTGIAALCFGAPSAINLAFSPWRHLASPSEDTVPMLPRLAAHDDVLSPAQRLYTVNYKRPYDRPEDPFAPWRKYAKREDVPVLNGEELGECQIEGGITTWFEIVTDDLTNAGYAGSAILGTDLYSAYWMFGDFKPVKGAAPWYYGGLPGVENADYIVVPTCPMAFTLRSSMLKSLKEQGWSLREKHRHPLYILLEPVAP
ncbi:MAG: hypothetical protein KDE00_10390 [Rhodobacteraceae bacterium]|nr:hypothetical protein [Paracoccaceae bacterium]